MSKVNASITMSVDGYVTGPDDGPGKGLGEGGERLHYWVFGQPWTYDAEPADEPGGGMSGPEKEWMDSASARMGAAVAGRNMYEAAGHWGDQNPWGVPCFIVTSRTQEQPEGDAFVFVDGVAEAVARAKEAAGDKDVAIGGGADVIRQALGLGLVDELSIVIAPVVLGGGKRLFEGFEQDVELEHAGVLQSQWATIIDYRVKRS
jgi:dihydrofolate reductase